MRGGELMSGWMTHRSLEFSFPAREEPKWGVRIDRWYQLDASAYGLAEAYFKLNRPGEGLPDFMLLASEGGSNRTDLQFARTGGSSPSKFVHTLPNIRGSILCQLMGWQGPLLCIQNDPQTLVTALGEAMDLLEGTQRKIWVWSVTGNNQVHWFDLHRFEVDLGPHDPFEIPVYEFRKSAKPLHPPGPELKSASDIAFLEWLRGKEVTPFVLPGNDSSLRAWRAEHH